MATLPGYVTAQITVPAQTQAVTVELRLANVVRGPELVVERSNPDQTAAQPGVSQAVSHPTIKDTAEIGVFEDLMSAIQLLPGVAYGGDFNATPSVRGGDPSETVAYLDGAPFLYPYHWGGLESVFDPNFVETAELSDGIISARNGDMLSALLEVTSKSSLTAEPRLNFSLSTTGMDAWLQYPVSGQLGILVGGKATWMEVPFALYGAFGDFNQVPSILDGYAKVEWKPIDSLRWDTNFFYGSDGFDQKKGDVINLNLESYPQEYYQTGRGRFPVH